MTTQPNPLADPAYAPMLAKYFDAQANAPHPEKVAYAAILDQRHSVKKLDLLAQSPVSKGSGGDRIIAAGPSPHGGVEMIVRKADGVVVLLMPQQMQVKNTPKGPKNYTPQTPLELPLVLRCAPTELQQRINRMLGQPPLPGLLMFQGRFSTVAREINLL